MGDSGVHNFVDGFDPNARISEDLESGRMQPTERLPVQQSMQGPAHRSRTIPS